MDQGFSQDEVRNISSHSLKATTLSWANKFGIDREARRDSGYHANPADKAVAAYSRDAMAAPLRHLVVLFSAVASGSFLPDESRSGRFVDPPRPPPESSSDSSSSSEPAKDSPCSGEEFDPIFENIILNKNMGTVHVCEENGFRLMCGKDLPMNSERLAELPAEPRLCSRCF